MEPTIPAGSSVTVDFSAYDSKEIRRNDLVCFVLSESPDQVFVFRIAGLPNEKLSLRDSTIHANGKPTEVKGIVDSDFGALAEPLSLASDEYYVLGDNTKEARDSRYFGPIKRSQILGKIIEIQPNSRGNER